MPRLTGKTALITGGGSGIGRATAVLFAQEGAFVTVSGRRVEPLQETVALIQKNGGEANFITGDVVVEADVAAMIKHAVTAYGQLDIVVHSAGVTRRNEQLSEITEADWDYLMNINLKGFMWLAKHAIQQMLSQESGSIVTIASLLALIGIKGLPTYSATKGGVISLARNLAAEYAGNNIRINIISPGDVLTDMAYVGRENFDDYLQEYSQHYPLRRIGQPEDVAYAALFLGSDEANWITGQNLILDGGVTLS